MRRWLTQCFIALYLGALAFGIGSHGFKYCDSCHPGMYFVVWDMFCGWSTWEQRLHVIGEGESGTYYRLAPGPWGDYQPYSNLSRHHYDNFGNHSGRLAANCLKHTDHEPMRRVFVVEESWNKKFNLPPSLNPNVVPVNDEKFTYLYLRDELQPDGTPIVRRAPWHQLQMTRSISENPRLHAQARQGTPVMLADGAANQVAEVPH